VPLGRAAPVINDIGGILLTRIPVQDTVLKFLIQLDSIFQKNPYAYSAPEEWNQFWSVFYLLFSPQSRELKRLSAGRRPLYSRRKTYRRKPRSKKTRKQ
jgi:hypothetical protein